MLKNNIFKKHKASAGISGALTLALLMLALCGFILTTGFQSYAQAPDTVTEEGAAGDTAADGDRDISYYTALLIKRAAELASPDNIGRAVTWFCSLAGVLIITLVKGSITKLRAKISGSLEKTTEKTDELVEGYNNSNQRLAGLEQQLEHIMKAVDDKSAADEETARCVRGFFELLYTVYNNSTTIPEGMKDILRMKYAEYAANRGEGPVC